MFFPSMAERIEDLNLPNAVIGRIIKEAVSTIPAKMFDTDESVCHCIFEDLIVFLVGMGGDLF